MEELRSSLNSMQSRRTQLKAFPEAQKYSTPSLRCHFHPDKQITNFCRSQACLLPLCPQCVPIHVSSHNNKGTSAQLETLETIYEEAKSIIQNIRGESLSNGGRVIELKSQFKNFPENLSIKLQEVKEALFQEITKVLTIMGKEIAAENDELTSFNVAKLDEIEINLRKAVASAEQSMNMINSPNFMRVIIDTFSKKEAETHRINAAFVENKLQDIYNQIPEVRVEYKTLLETIYSEFRRLISVKCKGVATENAFLENLTKGCFQNCQATTTQADQKQGKQSENTEREKYKIDSINNISAISEDPSKNIMNLSFNKLMGGAKRAQRAALAPILQNNISGNPKIIEIKANKGVQGASDKNENFLNALFDNNETSFVLISNNDITNRVSSNRGDVKQKLSSNVEKKLPLEPRCASVSPIRSENIPPHVFEDEWKSFFNIENTQVNSKRGIIHQRSASNSVSSKAFPGQNFMSEDLHIIQANSQKSDAYNNYFSFRPGFSGGRGQEGKETGLQDPEKISKKIEVAPSIIEELKRDPYMTYFGEAPPVNYSNVQNVSVEFGNPSDLMIDTCQQNYNGMNQLQNFSGKTAQGPSKSTNGVVKSEEKYLNNNMACNQFTKPPQREISSKEKDTLLREKANEVLRNLHELSQGDIHIKRENVASLSGSKRKLIFSKEGINLALTKKI